MMDTTQTARVARARARSEQWLRAIRAERARTHRGRWDALQGRCAMGRGKRGAAPRLAAPAPDAQPVMWEG